MKFLRKLFQWRRILLLLLFTDLTLATAQQPKPFNAAEILLALQKMQVLSSVLYVGAHPDDENNSLLAYFANGGHYRTAYFSATRGDGGQNHIGDEQGSSLGILRTQELLAARRIDGAGQYFSRAIDFGYTTSADETLKKWGRDEILADFVYVIRKFKPDIIIARFPTTGEGRHGHHTASAILVSEAFRAVGDVKRFPEQLSHVDAWQPKRLFWNAFPRVIEARGGDPSKLIKIDIGGFNPLLGKSYPEVGAEARSMHKCQGMGTSKSRGPDIEYFELLDGEPAANGLFEGVDISWSRVPGTETVQRLLQEAYGRFDASSPERILPLLVEAYAELQKLDHHYWVQQKQKELLQVIQACAGLWLEAAADAYSVSPGGMVKIKATLISRADHPVTLQSIALPGFAAEKTFEQTLENNRPFTQEFSVAIPATAEYTQPYWLQQPAKPGRFVVQDQGMIGAAENVPPIKLVATLRFGRQPLRFETPVAYRWRDQFDGDRYRPLEIAPDVTANFEGAAFIFPDGRPQEIRLQLKNGSKKIAGKLYLELPNGWLATPQSIPFALEQNEDEMLVRFTVAPPAHASDGKIRAVAESDGKRFSRRLVRIAYKHVPIQSYFPPAEARIVRLDLRKNDEKIGYVMGAGDLVPQSLAQIGYQVTLLSDGDLEKSDLSVYDTIITGVRAYSTRHRLRQLHKRLLKYVQNGGVLVMQYNSNRGNVVENLGPYPMKLSFDRVDEEDAPIAFVNPSHPLLNSPNKITQADFKGWVHDRGLYFANEFDSRYETILSSHDSGKPPIAGGLLYAKYGGGVFIYAGYSFFRQLPAGVPGAYRLLVNLISAGH